MITEARIQNFKSIHELTLKLGRVSVLIGENGSGKSNILEALAFASAASQDKLDKEFLVSRGIRVAEPQFMRSAFPASTEVSNETISLNIEDSKGTKLDRTLVYQTEQSAWQQNQGARLFTPEELEELFRKTLESKADVLGTEKAQKALKKVIDDLLIKLKQFILDSFLIYSQENR